MTWLISNNFQSPLIVPKNKNYFLYPITYRKHNKNIHDDTPQKPLHTSAMILNNVPSVITFTYQRIMQEIIENASEHCYIKSFLGDQKTSGG